MNEREHELFEAELRRLKPARLPDELQSRLEDEARRWLTRHPDPAP